MFRNYLKITSRNLWRNKFYTLINLLGLSVGMASVVMIVLFIKDELSYDTFHDEAGDIYRIAWFSGDPQTRTPHPMAQALVKDFPQVQSAVSLSPIWGPGLTKRTFSISNPATDAQFDETDVLSVDSTFFDVFSFNLIKGNKEKVLREPNRLLISESMEKKYFGDQDAIGQFLITNNGSQDFKLEVEGVFEDVPESSHFHFSSLVSYVTMKGPNPGGYYTWADFGHFNYIRLQNGADPEILEEELLDWVAGYLEWLTPEALEQIRTAGYYFKLQRITNIHLQSRIRWELEPNGNMAYVYIMTAAAIFILIIASVNFMNLTSAKSTERAREIGVRKSLGAYKNQLVVQFLGESTAISLISIILAGLLIEVAMPFFNEITGKALYLDYFGDPQVVLLMAAVGLLVGLLAGIYPALVMSSAKPIMILRGEFAAGVKGNVLRKFLLIFQFAISMILIASSAIIYSQLDFIQNKGLGFDQEEVLVVRIKENSIKSKFETLKNELLNLEGVSNVSAASNIPGWQFNQNPMWERNDNQNRVSVSEFRVDYDIFETLGLNLLEGRPFDEEIATDSAGSYVINQTLATALNLNEPIGKELVLDADGSGLLSGTVVGLVEDFHFQSLHQPVRPLIFQVLPNSYNFVLMKVNTANFEELIASVESVWQQFDHRFAFEFSFLDQNVEDQYRAEQRLGQVFSGFSVLAVIIASMGLFGLASLILSKRTKEVSIRKVMGASSSSIFVLLLKGFTSMVLIAIVIGTPVTWLVMDRWLSSFSFRIALSPTSFILAGMGILMVAWLTVGMLTFKTINANPVKYLREE